MKLSIRLETFEGPLDLLLHLIDKNKVSITDIPIAIITDQYIAYIEAMEQNKMETMSEFIEMAATLIQIKTKMLLPKKKDENDEEIDPRQELMEQLLEYKKYKLMAEHLKDKQIEAQQVFFKVPTIPQEVSSFVPKADPHALLEGLDFSMMYKIFNEVIKKNKNKIDPIRSKFGTIKKETFTVHDKMEEILQKKKLMPKLSFRQLLTQQITKSEVIATFLAVLELMKVSKIKVVQVNVFHDIDIEFI
ncbi:segregation/condensation protein A [Vallitaleaceae bacterium 9-2]